MDSQLIGLKKFNFSKKLTFYTSGSSYVDNRFTLSHLICIACLLAALTGGFCARVTGQNLVPNPSFETFTTCPFGVGLGGPTEAASWESFLGSTDYFNICGTPAYRGVPTNFQGYQVPHTGEGYMGAYFIVENTEAREFARAELREPLEAGVCYKVGCWINLCNEGCGTNKIGILLSTDPVDFPIGITPQVNATAGFYTDTVNWVFIHDYVIADGGERFITIGNFYPAALSPLDPFCNKNPKYAYYYYDDVIVEKASNEPIGLNLGSDVTVCESHILNPGLDPSIHDYQWSNGSTDPLIQVNASGTYSVTVTKGCLEEIAAVNVTIQDVAPVDLGEPTVNLCSGESITIELDANAGQYIWQDGSTQNKITISSPGTYSVTMDDGCDISTDVIEILGGDPVPEFTLGNDTFLCPGESIHIVLPQLSVSFQWQDGSDASDYTITNEGTYSLTISNACGETHDELSVIEIVPPSFTLGQDLTGLCDGEVIEYSFDPELGDFLWHDGNTFPTYTITTSGLYSLTVTNECGSNSDEVLVEMNGHIPFIDLGPDLTLCEGEEVTLSITSEMNTTYEWPDGSEGSTYNIAVAGTYTLHATNDCGSVSDEIVVHYLSPPAEFSLGRDTSLCPGEILVLTSPDVTNEILWQDGSSQPEYIVNASGRYSLQIENECGSQSDTLEVSVADDVAVVNLGDDLVWCAGDTFYLDATQDYTAEYRWNTNSTLPIIEVVRPGLYTVEVISHCNTAADTLFVIPGTACADDVYYIPNIFSPNGDGVNDDFDITFSKDLAINSVTGSIYDRWGNLLYVSSGDSFLWDGRFGGKEVMPGVYVYVLEIGYVVSGVKYEERVTGSVALVR